MGKLLQRPLREIADMLLTNAEGQNGTRRSARHQTGGLVYTERDGARYEGMGQDEVFRLSLGTTGTKRAEVAQW